MPELPYEIRRERVPPIAEGAPRCASELRFMPFHGVVKIRYRGPDPDGWLAAVLAGQAPAPNREVSVGPVACAWLAPGEWLLTGAEDDVVGLIPAFRDAAGDAGLVSDLTHGRAVFELSGPGARGALAAHCPLDLRAEAMPAGVAARSLLGETRMLLSRRPDRHGECRFLLVVDQTMARYVAALLGGYPGDAKP